MPVNREQVKDLLGRLGLPQGREEEIQRELGDHVEDHAADLQARGMDAESATREVLDAVSNWQQFRNAILAAESEEVSMNYRTKALWLPAMCALILSNGLLAIFQVFGPAPRFYWFHGGKSLEIFCAFVIPWLLTQPVVGAVAAYWSRRAGGTVRYQLLAATAPATALMGLFLLILAFAIISDKHASHTITITGFLVLTVTWVLLPALPLLAGAAPFVRRPQTRS